MTDYTWVGGTSADASTAANWNPSSGIPNTSSDTAIFANAAACTWTIATVGNILIKETYTGILTINNAVAITGLVIDAAGKIDAAAGRILTFSGTPPYNSGKTHIVHGYSTDDSPFRTETARGHITYKMNGSSAITYDSGIYPHILLTNGSHTPDYAMVSGTRTNQIKFHSLTVNSGATFAPASATPSANDRLRKWISETAVASQFAISSGVASFNGGYAEWTFQAISSGFPIPTSGVATYNQCKFTFDKMVIDASVAGVGKWAQIIAPSRLILTDFTVNVGASVKGSSSSTGCAILLVNKPKIHGTWSFLPVADGYYVYPKTGETLGYPSGGTGLNSLGSANQVLATNAGATAMEWQTVSAGSGDITGVTITTDSGGGSKAEDTGGSADFSILGATGVGVTNSGTTITAVAIPAEIDHDSLQNFVAAEHVDWAGASAGTIHASNYTNTVPDATNVAAAGALMDSEVTNLADVKAFNPAAYATAAQGAKADTALQPGTAVAPGDPVSLLANDAGYLDAATTPTANFCQWNDISADITASGVGSNTLVNNWSYTTGNTDIRDAMSSGVWTCTAALAGTYLIISKIQFKTGTLSESAGVNYKLQNLNYKNAGGGTPSSGTLSNFARHMNADFYIGYILETQFILTIADTDTFGVYAKIATSSGSGNFKIASGSNAMTSLTMIKIA
ncbi:MAG: hypothetical protein Tp1100DCM51572_20 [Prokaryotic dsDNA virus sp.]|nr:MAG: hypothetical protein Tp1100DCM51572_20 [Prokaryotic dsDNA virus sp.]|tara:strand:+ start:16855 stop:18903 length:2049 start_codon:yes stop_codon:yes gene_type:complete